MDRTWSEAWDASKPPPSEGEFNEAWDRLEPLPRSLAEWASFLTDPAGWKDLDVRLPDAILKDLEDEHGTEAVEDALDTFARWNNRHEPEEPMPTEVDPAAVDRLTEEQERRLRESQFFGGWTWPPAD